MLYQSYMLAFSAVERGRLPHMWLYWPQIIHKLSVLGNSSMDWDFYSAFLLWLSTQSAFCWVPFMQHFISNSHPHTNSIGHQGQLRLLIGGFACWVAILVNSPFSILWAWCRWLHFLQFGWFEYFRTASLFSLCGLSWILLPPAGHFCFLTFFLIFLFLHLQEKWKSFYFFNFPS